MVNIGGQAEFDGIEEPQSLEHAVSTGILNAASFDTRRALN